jgi:hypothetical protein
MLPSFYLSNDKAHTWSVGRAAVYGAGIGAVAALFKTLAPSHGPFAHSTSGTLPEIAFAVLGFALLCAAAAALRNFIAQRLIWPQS